MTERHAEIRGLRRGALLAVVVALLVSGCSSEPDQASEPQGGVKQAAESDTQPHTDLSGEGGISLEWEEASLSGESFLDDVVVTDAGFFAYRFSHGARAWRSSDGLTWESVPLEIEAESADINVSSVTVGGPGYLALGDDRGPVSSEDSLIAWTSSDGSRWSRHEIHLEPPPLGVFSSWGLREVVGGPSGFLALGTLDRSEGIDEHSPVLWSSDDGREWTLLGTGAELFGPGAQVWDVIATETGYLAGGYVEGPEGPPVAWWESTDGRLWEPLAPPFGEDPDVALGPGGTTAAWEDGLVMAATHRRAGIRLWRSTGTGWEELPPHPLLEHTPQMLVSAETLWAGSAGIFLVGSPRHRQPPVVVEKEGLVITLDFQGGGVSMTDASTGEVILEDVPFSPDHELLRFSDDSLTVIDPATGTDLVTVTLAEFEAARAQAHAEAGFEPEEEPSPILWFSPDGERWLRQPVEEALGTRRVPERVFVGEDSILLVWPFGFGEDGMADGEEEEMFEDPPARILVGRVGNG